MSSPQATSSPRIPRRGAGPVERSPRPAPQAPARRRTSVLSVSSHVVPFDAAADTLGPVADRTPVRLPAGEALRVPADRPAGRASLADQIARQTPRDDAPEQTSPGVAPPPWHVRVPETDGSHGSAAPGPRPAQPEVRRRTVALVAVPVVLALGLATVALLSQDDRSGGGEPVPTALSGGGTGSSTSGTDDPPAQSPATGLDPGLEARFAAAVDGAAADGVALTLTSGWRSAEDQAGLVESTLARYGSAEEAHRWVLPPERSAHVAGLAIDVGPTDGALWLESNGAEYGLCRVYANEVWHFEPVIEAGGVCPDLLPDSSSGWDGIEF